jgi:hypothetical protein
MSSDFAALDRALAGRVYQPGTLVEERGDIAP